MAGKRRRRRRRRAGNWFSRLSIGKKIALCMGSLVLCLAASGVIFVAAKLGKLDTEEIDAADIQVNKEAEETGEGYTNVALFGIDSRSGELEKGTRTDCIIVASLNNKTKEVRMSSVYRDTLLDIKDGHLQKCNAAYSFGGPTQAINMLNKNLDLDIEKFATVDFAAISETIDLLGGLDINVKKEEIQYLNKFVGETARVAKKKAKKVTKPGKQHPMACRRQPMHVSVQQRAGISHERRDSVSLSRRSLRRHRNQILLRSTRSLINYFRQLRQTFQQQRSSLMRKILQSIRSVPHPDSRLKKRQIRFPDWEVLLFR